MNRAVHLLVLLPVALCFGALCIFTKIGYALVSWAESFDEEGEAK